MKLKQNKKSLKQSLEIYKAIIKQRDEKIKELEDKLLLMIAKGE